MERRFDNYNELKEYDKEVAEELLEKVGSGGWQEDTIHLYTDSASFARYELTGGWYADNFRNKDYSGAPNPLDYILESELGDDLISSWDEAGHFQSSNGTILTTSHGW